MPSPPRQSQLTPPTGHMVVCGDDALAHRLAADLQGVYNAVDSAGDTGLQAAAPDDRALRAAGAVGVSALALVYEDAETNIRAALTARRLNPRLRLVIRLYNGKLGEHLAQLLDQATPGVDLDVLDTSTTVLSDADTAAPALAATAVAGTSKVVQADASTTRQVLQILSGFAGLLLLPVLVAGLLEALGTLRSANALGRVPRRLSGHVVLLGLGKVGTRVLAKPAELDIPVVCVEENPWARGISLARRLRVPVVLGNVTQEGVLETPPEPTGRTPCWRSRAPTPPTSKPRCTHAPSAPNCGCLCEGHTIAEAFRPTPGTRRTARPSAAALVLPLPARRNGRMCSVPWIAQALSRSRGLA